MNKSIELLNKINNYLKDYKINLDTENNTIIIKPKYKDLSNYNLVRTVSLYQLFLSIITTDYN